MRRIRFYHFEVLFRNIVDYITRSFVGLAIFG